MDYLLDSLHGTTVFQKKGQRHSTGAFKPDAPPPTMSEGGRGHHRRRGWRSFLPKLELGMRKEKDALRTDRPWRSLERNLGRRGGLFPEEQFGKKFIVKPRKVLQVDFPPG